MAASFLASGALARPSASSATLTGRTFSRTDLSGETLRTLVMETARRRGEA